MADRVKYFLLGLLFLVVAGVIAFDRWNSREGLDESEVAEHDRGNSGEIFIGPNRDDPAGKSRSGGNQDDGRNPHPLIIDPDPAPVGPDTDRPEVKPKPEPIKPAPATRERVHVVKSGEALEKISRQYYPGKVYKGIDLIVRANGLRNANVITEGQRLVIPAMDTRSTRRPVVVKTKKPKPSTKPARTSGSGVPAFYVVKSSDGDLYKICRRFYGRGGEGARVSRIMATNNLVSVRVKAGTRLKLPKK